MAAAPHSRKSAKQTATWDAIAAGHVEIAKATSVDFDFNDTHESLGTPFTAFLRNYICRECAFTCPLWMAKSKATDLVCWLTQCGADPSTFVPDTVRPITIARQIPESVKGGSKGDSRVIMQPSVVDGLHMGKSKGKSRGGGQDGKIETCLEFVLAGKTSLTAIMDMHYGFQQSSWLFGKGGFDPALELTVHLLDALKSNCATPQNCPRVPVPEPSWQLWGAIFERALIEGDTKIVAEGGQELRVDSMVVKEVSPVLRAMLASPMKEGTELVINVSESADTVRAFAEMVYTGALPVRDASDEVGTTEPSVDTLLGIFGLCHRWQSNSFADFVEAKLLPRVEASNFEQLLEVAVLHNSVPLRHRCLQIANNVQGLDERFRKGELSATVAAELRHLFGNSTAGNKKRRTLM